MNDEQPMQSSDALAERDNKGSESSTNGANNMNGMNGTVNNIDAGAGAGNTDDAAQASVTSSAETASPTPEAASTSEPAVDPTVADAMTPYHPEAPTGGTTEESSVSNEDAGDLSAAVASNVDAAPAE